MILDILERLKDARIEETNETASEMLPTDTLVTVLGSRERALFSVLLRIGRDIDVKISHLVKLRDEFFSYKNSKEIPADLNAKGEALHMLLNVEKERMEILHRVFWMEIREKYHEPENTKFCLRKGWKLVSAEDPELTAFNNFKKEYEDLLKDDCGNPDCRIHHPEKASAKA